MKSPFTHLIVMSLICVAVLAGYGAWYAVIVAKSASVAALQDDIDTKTESVSLMSTARAALSEIADDEATVQSYFVPETGVVAFIDSLEARGRLLGATVDVLSVSAGKTLSKPTLAFALSIEGTFDAVMRTVGAIEYAPYAISVSTFSIGQGEKQRWRASLNLLVGSVAATTATSTP